MYFLSEALTTLDIKSIITKIINLNLTLNDLSEILNILIQVVCIIFLMYIIIKIGNLVINRFVKRQEKSKIPIDTKKAKTLGAVLKSILKYTVYFFGTVAILEIFFGKISLAFASVGGVALGFGSQSLIKDILNGFFILFENQYVVGDYIDIEGKSGIVESVELRVTRIRDLNGDVHIIPNGLISKVTNHSKGNMRFLVDVNASYEENVDNVIDILDGVCDEFKLKNENVVEGPKVIGVTSYNDDGFTLRIIGKAKNMTQSDCENELRRKIKSAFDEKNIRTFYKRVKIIKDVEQKND